MQEERRLGLFWFSLSPCWRRRLVVFTVAWLVPLESKAEKWGLWLSASWAILQRAKVMLAIDLCRLGGPDPFCLSTHARVCAKVPQLRLPVDGGFVLWPTGSV
jgi:hypothetical protein